MNKILIVFIVIFLILIVYSFQSCDKPEEQFSNDNESEDVIDSEKFECTDNCLIEYGSGTEYDRCIQRCYRQ